MTLDALDALKWALPFRPVRLVTADGQVFDVRDPNHLWPGHETTLVAAPDDPAQTWVSLATASIARVEFLRPASPD
jgi:hypothetical protein